ncbi:hypothetical protein WA158_007381 [Blastocystis sp. Blastoise]
MAFNFEELKKRFNAQIDGYDQKCSSIPYIDLIREKTGVKRIYIVSFTSFLLFLIIYAVFGSNFIATLVGTVYPTYETLRYFCNPNPNDLPKLYTYWILYASFCLLDSVRFILIRWFPLYDAFKVAVFSMCYMDSINLAVILYDNLIAPKLNKQSLEEKIASLTSPSESSDPSSSYRHRKNNKSEIIKNIFPVTTDDDSNTETIH